MTQYINRGPFLYIPDKVHPGQYKVISNPDGTAYYLRSYPLQISSDGIIQQTMADLSVNCIYTSILLCHGA